jgi:chaperonin cofactor prefoldin
MNTYTVQDITNRLEDLDTYLDDLEMQLENARDARRELEEMVSVLSGLEKLQENTEKISLSPYLLTDLLTYREKHGGAWDYKTAALFDDLEKRLRNLEAILA